MPITPFRTRILAEGNSAPWSRTGTGERLLYTFGLSFDAGAEAMRQGTLAHIPITRNPYDRSVTLWVPPADALAAKGDDMQIPRGLTESDTSYATRLHIALDSWRKAGTTWGLLSQVLGYLLAYEPVARFVATRYDGPRAVDSALLSTQWDSYTLTRRPIVVRGADVIRVEPEHVYTEAGDGIWDWDSASHVDGSNAWWGGWLIVYPVAPNNFCDAAQAWGEGSTYTAAADGYYSTVTAGAYTLAGSYAGTSQVWGLDSTYTAAASGYYSTVSGGKYVAAGKYSGFSQAWGVSIDARLGLSIAQIVKQFKSANTWVRGILFSFDLTLFSPTDPVGGGINPDGEMGQWSTAAAGAYSETRFTDVAYGPEVI